MNKFRKLISTPRGFFFTLFGTLVIINLLIDLSTHLKGGEPNVLSSFVIAFIGAGIFTILRMPD